MQVAITLGLHYVYNIVIYRNDREEIIGIARLFCTRHNSYASFKKKYYLYFGNIEEMELYNFPVNI